VNPTIMERLVNTREVQLRSTIYHTEVLGTRAMSQTARRKVLVELIIWNTDSRDKDTHRT